jgi:BCD family chlorophyll transporter-like MFS transporter
MASAPAPLGWLGIVRLGLVQTALGAIVVLTTSTLNRVMVVEMMLPAMVPGILVGLHYAVQMTRPRMGHGSDVGRRRTPWIVGGMAVLALGAVAAAGAVALMPATLAGGVALSVAAFAMIGLGVGAAGTSLLVLMAKRTDRRRRAPAATIAWVMMILGFIVTAATAGKLLDPFSPERLLAVTAGVCGVAFLLAVLAVVGIEGRAPPPAERADDAPAASFSTAFREVWDEPAARRFAVFVFASMLAYSAQDLILEPFAGHVFGMTPGQSTALSGVQHGGVLLGMVLTGVAGWIAGSRSPALLRAWAAGGCVFSALALAAVAAGGLAGPGFPIGMAVFALGVANGAFAVAAIGSMMERVGAGRGGREGVRMGLWGAAQAVAFALGGFLGTVGADAARALLADPAAAYAWVFGAEALLFLACARLALRLDMDGPVPDADAGLAAGGMAGVGRA